ncbi:MAG: hypothetical protein ACFFDI_23655 [Promethearchaeota archaeon]
MTKYVLKHYQEGFEEDQERIGVEVAKSYIAPHQTTARALKEVYSRDDFDPETRLYAFKGKEMVGFLTSRVLPEEEDGIKKANLTPPQVLAEHDEEVSELLLNKAIEVLKSKGIKKVLAQFGARQSKNEDKAKEWGFKLVATDYYLYSIDLSNLDPSISAEKVIDFNYEKHLEDCAKILASETEREVDWVKGIFERWKENPDPNRKLIVIEEEGKVKAYTAVFKNNIIPTYAGLWGVWAESEDYMKQLLAKIAQIVKENKIERLTVAYTEESDIEQEKYKPIKFDFVATASRFEMDI